MRKTMAVVAVLATLLLMALPVGAITWGELDGEGHPNVGAMVVDWPGYGPWQWCSGTLIHPQVFLTAGHCTDGLDEYGIETVWVNFEQNAVAQEGLRRVEKVITHPEYGWGGSDPHDVGLLILAESAMGIKVAELPDLGLLDELKKERILRPGGPEGAKFTVVGYGGTLNWPPPDIYYEDERQVAQSEYVALTKVWLHMSQNHLKGDGGTCFGDSGGPAFWVDETGHETIVGVTSWGDAQCVATGFDYRIDIPQARDFIDNVIKNLP
jgi:secreted trypsin-like serine protease